MFDMYMCMSIGPGTRYRLLVVPMKVLTHIFFSPKKKHSPAPILARPALFTMV